MHAPNLDPHTRAAAQTEAVAADEAATETDPVLRLLVRWEDHYQRGEDLTPETLCGDDPRWVAALRRRIAKRKRLHAVLGLAPREVAVAGPPPEFPGHEVLEEIGRGGMGVVYRARDVRLGRIVAVKTVAEAKYATRDQIERFLDEARAIARLRHPNIIAIHAIGEHEGRPYFSLEFAAGGSLAEWLAARPLAAGQAGELVETLAQAVHAAHEAGIVHRDLKPSNVLLTAEGVPKVSDFGLAKLLDGDSARTCSGQVMGTPSYMAPEQAEGRSKQVGPAADVYALGAILYQALTGRPPFLGDSALETLKLVASTEPVPPRRLRPHVPRDLETICLKCLEKEPPKRYHAAAALAEDLRRFREGRPIAARPVGAAGRLGRWARRNRTLAGVTAVLIATFLLGTPSLLVLWLGARTDRGRAESERTRAIRALGEARAAHQQAEAQRGEAEAARRRAERIRDRALSAVRSLLGTETDQTLVEEMRPYRTALTAQGLYEAKELVQALEDDPQAQIERVHAHLALAGVHRENGDAAAAIAAARQAVAMAEDLVARQPSPSARAELAHALHRLSGLSTEHEAVRAYARRSNAIYQALRGEQPGHALDHAHSIALNDYNIGHVDFSDRRLDDAAVAFEEARTVCQEQIQRGDPTAVLSNDLARTLLYLCRVHKEAGRAAAAIETGRSAVAAYRALLDRDPASYPDAVQLYLAQEELGFCYQRTNRWSDVIACHEAARATLRAAAARHGHLVSRMAAIQRELAVVDNNLIIAYASDPVRYARPLRAITSEAYDICDKLTLVQPALDDSLRSVLAVTSHQLADYQVEDGETPDLEHYRRAERLWEELLRKDPARPAYRAGLVFVRNDLADALAARGRVEESQECRRHAFATIRGDAWICFEIALNDAENARLVGRYPIKLDLLQQQERRRKFARRALVMLREAVAAGFADPARIRREPALAPLQSDPELRAILTGLDDRAFPADPFAGP